MNSDSADGDKGLPESRDDIDPFDDGDEPRSWKAMLPFLIGAGTVVVVLIVILVVYLVRPPEERLTDSAKVQHTVNDAYSARNALNYDHYRDAFCRSDIDSPDFPTSVAFAEQNRRDNDAGGKLVVPSMEVEVIGDRATATVTWHREDAPKEQTTELKLVKVGDDWKVCSR